MLYRIAAGLAAARIYGLIDALRPLYGYVHNWAIAHYITFRQSGLGVHIYRLIGFRNRLLVLVNWAWDYLFFERGVRLIVSLPKEH
jgi:hypothetical protein